jgi:hypothetical protein
VSEADIDDIVDDVLSGATFNLQMYLMRIDFAISQRTG